ncbi:MAG TPA: hypothetical protein PK685_00250 [archaeon]|nr:hypothetical protein [archaeon]
MFYAVKKRKALEPLIATILLIVVSVILVTIILTWGKEFSTNSLNKTNNFGNLKASDTTNFIYPKSAQDGVVQFTYSPPNQITEDINITHYRVINIPEMTEPIALEESVVLSPSLNVLELPCLYEYSTTTPDLTIQLITAENTYIDIKTKDQGMVCTSGGTGTEVDPIIICTAEDLNAVRLHLDWNYSLGKDIDLQCFSRKDVNGWIPIGNLTTKFKGIFDGQNHVINNLYINRPGTDYIGLFGFADINSGIKYLGLNDTNIYGKTLIGSLAGANLGVISNSYANGYVKATGLGGGHANTGGLIGVNSGGTIFYSSFEGNVEGYGAGSMVGGLVGQNIIKGYISNCFAKGAVYGLGNYVGGFSGANDGARGIDNSYADCSVTGLNSATGGFVGATTLSTGEGISNCYSWSAVNGVTDVGGFVGLDYGEIFNNDFWDVNTSGQLTSADGEGKTTIEMKTQNTFTGWDFSSIWAISPSVNEGYPHLINNPPR